MKVIFLDFDGVLNSSGSFRYQTRLRHADRVNKFPKLNEQLDPVLCSNLQCVLDKYPECKVVISSTWRNIKTLDWLKEHLAKYMVDSSRVIGRTGHLPGLPRGLEIEQWLNDHPEVTKYIIIDDNSDMAHLINRLVKTQWDDGLTLTKAKEAIEMLRGQ